MARSMKKVPGRIERPVKKLVGEFYRLLSSRQVGKRRSFSNTGGSGPQAITLVWDLW
jgi:hypothetical protein